MPACAPPAGGGYSLVRWERCKQKMQNQIVTGEREETG